MTNIVRKTKNPKITVCPMCGAEMRPGHRARITAMWEVPTDIVFKTVFGDRVECTELRSRSKMICHGCAEKYVVDYLGMAKPSLE